MKIPIYVVHKPKRAKKWRLTRIENKLVDDILAMNKRKPLIPYNHDIEIIGVGEIFEEKYKEKYKIKEIE